MPWSIPSVVQQAYPGRGARDLPVLAIIGPTASGKSSLALALAERLGAEIISIDSAAVYRGMDIGSAKPTPEQRAWVPHHLIDIEDPDHSYSAGRFVRDAQVAVADIQGRGRLPLLVGGTMLYVRSLLAGIAELPQSDPELRAGIDARIALHGLSAAHADLVRLDPESAARIQPADRQRIQRALELIECTGKPLQQLYREYARPPALRARVLALRPKDRAVHCAAIDARFSKMLQDGLVDELRELRARFRLHPGLPSMRSVGYRQAWTYLEGGTDEAGLLKAGSAASRQLAKRQSTWLRQLPHELVLDPQSPDCLQSALAWSRSVCSG